MIPIGQSEGIQLEFKAAAALEQTSSIAREAVGMLNELGGSLWIGVMEENGIATSIDPVEDASTAARALRDSLIDLIEPAPTNDELVVESVEDVVIHVVLTPQDHRKPYALVKRGARHFVIRVADRNRPMAREELTKLFKDGDGESTRDDASRRLMARKNNLANEGHETFWLRYEPLVSCNIDPQNPDLETYLREPEATHNRKMGWTFVVPDKRPELSKDTLSTSIEDYFKVTIQRTGSIELVGDMEMLQWKGGAKEIWTLTLMEHCASLARLAGKVYDNHTDLGRDAIVLVDCALFTVGEWGLKPSSPRSLNYMMGSVSHYLDSKDLMWDDPISVSLEDLVQYPDYVAFRLVRRVFEAFGYREEAIPSEYNRQEKEIYWPES